MKLYQTWREVEQRGLKETPEYRNVLLRADRHASWLAGLVSSPRRLSLHQKQSAPTRWMPPKKPLSNLCLPLLVKY